MMKEITICGTVMNGSTSVNKALKLKLDVNDYAHFANRSQVYKEIIKKAMNSQVFGLDAKACDLEIKWGDFITEWHNLRKLAKERKKEQDAVMSPKEKLDHLRKKQDDIWEQINKLYSKLDSVESQIKKLEVA